MLETISFFAHYALVLLFGVLLSVAFAGVRLRGKRNLGIVTLLFVLCGILQVGAYLLFDEALVWKIYPIIVHLPILLLLCLYYRKTFATAIAAISTAYLCCQPAKWIGTLTMFITQSTVVLYLVRACVLVIIACITMKYLAAYLSALFNKDARSVYIFSFLPVVYYIFDYATAVYTDLWASNNRVVAEFLPFFLGIVYMLFCLVYYRQYEQKADVERKEHLLRITAEQQAREVQAIKRSEQEIRLFRHDMRLFLSSLAVCIADGEQDKATEMITAYASYIEGTRLEHFCENDTINYVLSDFAAKCRANNVVFTHKVDMEELKTEEILFASILSNALDNALNAQQELPQTNRRIRLVLRDAHGKLLLSVENPTGKKPTFADGLPVSNRKDHGYGTQSIRYMTQRLGGNCQFLMQDDVFILRVII